MAHQPQNPQSAAEMSPEIENQIVERGEFANCLVDRASDVQSKQARKNAHLQVSGVAGKLL